MPRSPRKASRTTTTPPPPAAAPRGPKLRIVLYARGFAPDLLGSQRRHAQRNARLLSTLTREQALPLPGAFMPLAAALPVLLRSGGTPLSPHEPALIPLLF